MFELQSTRRNFLKTVSSLALVVTSPIFAFSSNSKSKSEAKHPRQFLYEQVLMTDTVPEGNIPRYETHVQSYPMYVLYRSKFQSVVIAEEILVPISPLTPENIEALFLEALDTAADTVSQSFACSSLGEDEYQKARKVFSGHKLPLGQVIVHPKSEKPAKEILKHRSIHKLHVSDKCPVNVAYFLVPRHFLGVSPRYAKAPDCHGAAIVNSNGIVKFSW